jgi:SAM-dependent methyltransferase
MPARDWDQHYLEGFLPWDTDLPEPTLVTFVQNRAGDARGRVLDVGCGTGTHALWLAAQGFDVVGIDISPRAIERARAKATAAETTGARFEVLDFLSAVPAGAPFDLVFDRGVFHIFDDEDERARFAAQVARCLAPGGHWLSLIGSTEGPPREEGPPRRSARDIAAAIEPVLEIVELRSTVFDPGSRAEPRAWFVVSRPRLVPAQPSTKRET